MSGDLPLPPLSSSTSCSSDTETTPLMAQSSGIAMQPVLQARNKLLSFKFGRSLKLVSDADTTAEPEDSQEGSRLESQKNSIQIHRPNIAMPVDGSGIDYLHLTVLSAQGLKNKSMFGSMSVYAVTWIDPSAKQYTSVAQNGGCAPVWEQKLLLELPFSSSSSCSLMVQVFSQGALSDTLLGSVCIPVSDIERGYNKIEYMACQLVKPSGRIQGLLNLSMEVLDSAGARSRIAVGARDSWTDLNNIQTTEAEVVSSSQPKAAVAARDYLDTGKDQEDSSPTTTTTATIAIATATIQQYNSQMPSPASLSRSSTAVKSPCSLANVETTEQSHSHPLSSGSTSTITTSAGGGEDGMGFPGVYGGSVGAYVIAEAAAESMESTAFTDGFGIFGTPHGHNHLGNTGET